MKTTHAAIAAVAAAVIGIGGGAAIAQIGSDNSATPDSAPVASSPAVAPSPSTAPGPVDKLSEANLLSERVYADLSGSSFTRVDPDPRQPLGVCFDDTFSDVLPDRSVPTIEASFVGDEDGLRIVEQLAQVGSAQQATATADEIVSRVGACNDAIQGGDFGYAGPDTIVSEPDRKIVYFRAFNSDRAFGGFVVFSVGTRVGVLLVADTVGEGLVIRVADKAATIAGE